jgi:hypothetical protein
MKNKVIYILIALALLTIIVSVSFYSEQIPPTFATGKLRFFLFYLSAFFIVMLPALFPWGQEGYRRHRYLEDINTWRRDIINIPYFCRLLPYSSDAEVHLLQHRFIDAMEKFDANERRFLKNLKGRDLTDHEDREHIRREWDLLVKSKEEMRKALETMEQKIVLISEKDPHAASPSNDHEKNESQTN